MKSYLIKRDFYFCLYNDETKNGKVKSRWLAVCPSQKKEFFQSETSGAAKILENNNFTNSSGRKYKEIVLLSGTEARSALADVI